MITIPDRDPVDVPGTRARKRSRNNTIPLIGVLIAFVLGFGLVSLMMHGRTVPGDAPVIKTSPAAITGPVAPTTTPPPPTPNTP
jgi:hypothetical protein